MVFQTPPSSVWQLPIQVSAMQNFQQSQNWPVQHVQVPPIQCIRLNPLQYRYLLAFVPLIITRGEEQLLVREVAKIPEWSSLHDFMQIIKSLPHYRNQGYDDVFDHLPFIAIRQVFYLCILEMPEYRPGSYLPAHSPSQLDEWAFRMDCYWSQEQLELFCEKRNC